ncbi:phosphatase PAP2 family protein [Leifsonia shinshuensis]|uniref:phosphatase PAP2 family protein n=1 Tax=Leifsonia shinshuensis TaxID=150026 RepID=UPI001F51017A|nr:phosphatase PAP2 family protein [Leifsonia shinshuensis]MCI0159296.1 phosphatase PAP2 family protein [Leifsonia shinshuensis]
MKPAQLRIPRHWIVWTVVLFALTFALGFAAKWIAALRMESLGASINRVNSPLLDKLALVLDKLDQVTVVGVILVIVFIILLFVKGWRLALGTVVVTGLGWITTLVVKTVVAEPRPSTAGLTHLLHVNPATLSYPSGHVVFATALVTALAMVCRGTLARTIVLVIGAVFVLLVMWSRLYVGVHYGSDVVGGVLNGVAGVLLFAGLWNLVASRVFAGRGRRVAA